MTPTWHLYTDGGSRGNPGPAGYGFVVVDVSNLTLEQAQPTTNLIPAGIILEKCGNYLGLTTNNQAEYAGLEAGLTWVAKHNHQVKLNIFMDSLLIVNQIKGLYKVKHPDLQPYYQRIVQLLNNLDLYSIQHIRRNYNALADSLANRAMDIRGRI